MSEPIVQRVAGWSARHRKTAVFGWLLLVVAAIALGQQAGATHVKSYDPGQSGQAERVLNRPVVQQPASESVLIQGRPGHTLANDPELGQAVRQVVATLRHLPQSATAIRSPFSTRGLVNGRSALVTFDVAGKPGDDDQTVVPAMNAIAAIHVPGVSIDEAGGATLDRAIGNSTSQDFHKAELTSVPISLVLLLIVFGALIAAGIPLLLAGTAVISAISLMAIPGRWLPVDSTTSSIVLLVGMAVGIDYSLFYLRRVREERAAGHTTRDAIATAAATSGRAIVVSGLTVMISLAGLFLTGIDVFSGVAVGTIMVVGVAVLGSLTFLPGLLSMLGTWTDRGRIPFLGKRRTLAHESRFLGPAGPDGGAQAARLGRHGHSRAARPRRPDAVAAPGKPRHPRPAIERAGGAHPERHLPVIPRRARAGRGGCDRAEPVRPPGQRRGPHDQPLHKRERRDPGADHHSDVWP
jgi:RND superfamily putative drug exporter